MIRVTQKGLAISLIVLLLALTGCSSDVESVSKVDNDSVQSATEEAPQAEATSNEESNVEEPVVSGPLQLKLGEVGEIPGEYSLSVIGVTETDERNTYSKKEVAQVLLVDFAYENLGLDDTFNVTELNFKFIDEGGNMCDTYPVTGEYDSRPVLQGSRSFGTLAVGTVEESSKIRVLFYSNPFDSDYACEFDLNVNESVEVDFSNHEQPTYENAFDMGDTVTIETSKGSYNLTINSVSKTDTRNQFAGMDPSEVYVISYTYENIDYEDELLIMNVKFEVIDANGNMMSTYPVGVGSYPEGVIKGTKCTTEMGFGAHSTGDKIILVYTDSMLSSTPDVIFNATVE